MSASRTTSRPRPTSSPSRKPNKHSPADAVTAGATTNLSPKPPTTADDGLRPAHPQLAVRPPRCAPRAAVPNTLRCECPHVTSTGARPGCEQSAPLPRKRASRASGSAASRRKEKRAWSRLKASNRLREDHKRKDETMGKTIMGAVVSLDGFMADDNDGVGPLFDWSATATSPGASRAPSTRSAAPRPRPTSC